jgi:hypothetical protein
LLLYLVGQDESRVRLTLRANEPDRLSILPAKILDCIQRELTHPVDLRALSRTSRILETAAENYFLSTVFQPMVFDEAIPHTAFMFLARHAVLDRVDTYLVLRRMLHNKAKADPAFACYVSFKKALPWLAEAAQHSFYGRATVHSPGRDFVTCSVRFPCAYYLDVLDVLAATLFPALSPFWIRVQAEAPDLFQPRRRRNAFVETGDLYDGYPFVPIFLGWAQAASTYSASILLEKLDGLAEEDGYPNLKRNTNSITGSIARALGACGNVTALTVIRDIAANNGSKPWRPSACGAKTISYFQTVGNWDWSNMPHYRSAAKVAVYGVSDVLEPAREALSGEVREHFAQDFFYHAFSAGRIGLCHRVRSAFPDICLPFFAKFKLRRGFPFDNEMARLCNLRPGLPYLASPVEVARPRFRGFGFEFVSPLVTFASCNRIDLFHHMLVPDDWRRFKERLDVAMKNRFNDDRGSGLDDSGCLEDSPSLSILLQTCLKHRLWDMFRSLSRVLRKMNRGRAMELKWTYAALNGDWKQIRDQFRPNGAHPPIWWMDWKNDPRIEDLDEGWPVWEGSQAANFRRAHLIFYAASFGPEELQWVLDNAFSGQLPECYHFAIMLLAAVQDNVAMLEIYHTRFRIQVYEKDAPLLLRFAEKAICDEAAKWVKAKWSDLAVKTYEMKTYEILY